jgi:endonuclease YncB( thermonuclease family)
MDPGRTLGFVFVGDVNVNKELLKQGLAWHYKQYNKDAELAALEQEARKKKIELWSHPNPVAPWDFRRK